MRPVNNGRDIQVKNILRLSNGCLILRKVRSYMIPSLSLVGSGGIDLSLSWYWTEASLQSVRQSVSQSVSQSISQSISQSVSQSVSQLVRRSVSQSVSQ